MSEEEEFAALRQKPAPRPTVEARVNEVILPKLPDTDDARKLCDLMLPEVFKMYRDIINDTEAPASARISAGNAIADRAIGRATSINNTVDKTNEVTEIEIKFV